MYILSRWGVLLVVAATLPLGAQSSPPVAPGVGAASGAAPVTAEQRADLLDRFARAYFPGRSGQIMVVPREGEMITERSESYFFMHGSPWEYDVHIPLFFYGPAYIRQGAWLDDVRQQDVAPTLATLLHLPPAATMTGRSLPIARPDAGRPRAIVLLVLDAMRADYFETRADVMPTLGALRRDGASFSNARVDYLPTLTSVGHATISTGTDPRVHGLAANNLFNRVTGRPQGAFAGLSPAELMALTLSDLWNLETDGAAVIIAQGGAVRAAASLAGHGACLVNGRPVVMATYDAGTGAWMTNPECYRLPDYVRAMNIRTYWEAAGGRWMGHPADSPVTARHTALFQQFEGDALVSMIEREPIGADEVPDLVLVNLKAPDYVSHMHGPESEEMRVALGELDRQVDRIVEAVAAKVGPDGYVIAVTADHGMPSRPAPGHAHYADEIASLIDEHFDAGERRIVTYYGDPANSQIYIDTRRLAALGHDLGAVARYVESLPFVLAAFTEDEVRAHPAAR
jgi:hypothetical protein